MEMNEENSRKMKCLDITVHWKENMTPVGTKRKIKTISQEKEGGEPPKFC